MGPSQDPRPEVRAWQATRIRAACLGREEEKRTLQEGSGLLCLGHVGEYPLGQGSFPSEKEKRGKNPTNPVHSRATGRRQSCKPSPRSPALCAEQGGKRGMRFGCGCSIRKLGAGPPSATGSGDGATWGCVPVPPLPTSPDRDAGKKGLWRRGGGAWLMFSPLGPLSLTSDLRPSLVCRPK